MRAYSKEDISVLDRRISQLHWSGKLFIVLAIGLLIGSPAALSNMFVDRTGEFILHNKQVRLCETTVVAYRDSGLPEEQARDAALAVWNNPEQVEDWIRRYYGHPHVIGQ